MPLSMTGEGASVGRAVVANRGRTILVDDLGVEIDHALARDAPRLRSHSMRCVTNRAGKSIIDVFSVFPEATVPEHLVEIVALST